VAVTNLSDSDRRFAAVVGIGITLALGRVLLINEMRGFQPITWAQIPFFFRYDALVVFVLAWSVCWVDGSRSAVRRGFAGVLWTSVGLLIMLGALNFLVVREMHHPLTYRLMVISDSMRGVSGALGTLFREWVVLVAVATALTIAVSAALRRLPRLLAAARRSIVSPAGALAIVIVLAAANVWAAQMVRPSHLEVNPLVSMVLSLPARDPVLSGRAGDHEDFLPSAYTGSNADAPLKTRVVGNSAPPNVVMIVMESVGAKWLQLYGAPHRNSAEVEEVARRGATFSRVYAGSPNTSSAMAALFCSVYPLLALRTITRVDPSLRVPGLPAVLTQRGYRTAFVHGGNLEYDREGEFLKRHGFDEVIDKPPDVALAITSEAPTLEPALEWLNHHYGNDGPTRRQGAKSQPFFLTLWTVQTHFTYYFSDRSGSAKSKETPFDRYLNGVAAADRLVGDVRRALEKLGLIDNTLFIVTGDHGETFGLHGRRAHGFEIYNEEMWTPLVIAGPGIPVQTVSEPVRQIDLAPTILGLLGQTAPAEWQGVDLTKRTPPPRAYLFTGWSDFTFGVVDKERKAIFHYPEGASELYDLRSDPDEQRNLAATGQGARELADARRRIDTWIGFQNAFLAKFKGSDELDD
jgi:arylsulfatase A-like enzyme